MNERQNNFDVLRLAAATLVLFSHCWSLTEHGADPVERVLLHVFTGGELGVWIFFAISGYLVTASFVNRGSPLGFVKARFLRIYPAFAAALAYDLAIGAAVTSLPLAAFLVDPRTLAYVGGNLVFDIHYHLPGVFERNPHGSLVNGSLWTLPGEVAMYALVLALGVLAAFRRAAIACAVCAVTIAVLPFIAPAALIAPMRCFVVGMAVYLTGAVLSGRAALVGLVLAAAAGTLIPGMVASAIACIAVSYATLTLALRSPHVRIPAAIGDVSYGLYIYAYPLQQVIAMAFPKIGPWAMFAIAYPLTFGIAWASWHMIEMRALALKARLIASGTIAYRSTMGALSQPPARNSASARTSIDTD